MEANIANAPNVDTVVPVSGAIYWYSYSCRGRGMIILVCVAFTLAQLLHTRAITGKTIQVKKSHAQQTQLYCETPQDRLGCSCNELREPLQIPDHSLNWPS